MNNPEGQDYGGDAGRIRRVVIGDREESRVCRRAAVNIVISPKRRTNYRTVM